MTILKIAIRTVVLGLAVGLSACAGTGIKMPRVDNNPALMPPQPVTHCSETSGIYVQDYDMNPATEAAARVYGWFDIQASGDPKLEDPVVVILQGDDGKTAGIFVHEAGKVIQYDTMGDLKTKYPEPCRLPRRSQTV